MAMCMTQDDKKIRIIVDQRETRSGVVKSLDLMGANIELTELEVGDYVLSHRVCVERKDIDDFFKSLFQDRKLFSQLIDVAEAYTRPILILEGGDPFYSGRQINPKAIQGILNAIALLRIPILYSLNPAETAEIMYSIAKKEQDEDKRPVQMHGKRSHLSPKEQLEYTLTSIPDIGTVKAKNLLTHFKTLHAIVNADIEQFDDVELIGKTTAHFLNDYFKREY